MATGTPSSCCRWKTSRDRSARCGTSPKKPTASSLDPRPPLGISAADAAALLGSCDRREPAGRRDYAVLITLLRLGLRGGEGAGLTLDDIDGGAGEMGVRGKGRPRDRLPLPADAGEAIAAYLQRGRP